MPAKDVINQREQTVKSNTVITPHPKILQDLADAVGELLDIPICDTPRKAGSEAYSNAYLKMCISHNKWEEVKRTQTVRRL